MFGMWGKVQTSIAAWQAGQIQNKKALLLLGIPFKCYGTSLIWQQLTQLSLSWLLVSLHTQVTKVRIRTLPHNVYTVITQKLYTPSSRQTHARQLHTHHHVDRLVFTDSQCR